VYLHRVATQKERWETIKHLWFYSSFTHLFYNYIAIFGANAWIMISQPTDEFLTRHRHRPLACTYTERRRKKNGEFLFRIDFLPWFSLTIVFQLKCCRVPQLTTWEISFHRQDIAPPLMPLHLVTLYEVALQ
jgi:hypothetical protein